MGAYGVKALSIATLINYIQSEINTTNNFIYCDKLIQNERVTNLIELYPSTVNTRIPITILEGFKVTFQLSQLPEADFSNGFIKIYPKIYYQYNRLSSHSNKSNYPDINTEYYSENKTLEFYNYTGTTKKNGVNNIVPYNVPVFLTDRSSISLDNSDRFLVKLTRVTSKEQLQLNETYNLIYHAYYNWHFIDTEDTSFNPVNMDPYFELSPVVHR